MTGLRKTSLVLTLLLSAAAFGLALYELLSPLSGTTGTAGAILVTVSTALLILATTLLAFVPLPGWLFGLLLALVLLDAAGTAAAGYFLMADLLLAASLAAFAAGLAGTLANWRRPGRSHA